MPTPTNQKQFRINSKNKFTYRDASDGSGSTVEGYAALFNVLSEPLYELGGARECIVPGAFSRAISEPDDVRLLVNHDASKILARNISGTLQLKQDDIGLWFSATLPNTSYANDLRESMRRGDLSQCSFAFCIEDGSMQIVNGEPVQMVRGVELSDVSIVTYPAYTDTSASLRSQYLQIIDDLNANVNVDNGSPESTDVSLAAVDSIARANRKRQIELLVIE